MCSLENHVPSWSFKDRKDRRGLRGCFVRSGPALCREFRQTMARFRDIQLDSVNGTAISKSYLEQLIGSPIELLDGKTVLEVGAGLAGSPSILSGTRNWWRRSTFPRRFSSTRL